jgi:protein SCO1
MAARAAMMLALAVVGVLLVGLWLLERPHDGKGSVPQVPEYQSIEFQAAKRIDSPRRLDDFLLTDAAGQPFGRERLEGQWNLAFIGFTHCPDVCPMTLSLLEHLSNRLDDHDVALQPVFVSVDPERDTPEELARYSSYFGDRVVAATGQRQQLQRFCDSLDFAWVKVPMGQGNYTIDHSGALALIDPQARLVGYFLPPLDLEAIEIDLIRLAAVM